MAIDVKSEIFTGFAACTPSDSTLVTCRAIYIGGSGNLTISKDATTAGVVITAPPVGSVLQIGLDQGRVMAATTCTNIVLLV